MSNEGWRLIGLIPIVALAFSIGWIARHLTMETVTVLPQPTMWCDWACKGEHCPTINRRP